MKKILLGFITLLCITGCSKLTTYTNLGYTDFETKINNKESFVLVIGSKTCSACSKYKTVMEDVIKDKQVEIFDIDLASLSEEEYAKLYSKFVVTSTPTTIFIVDGQEKTTYDRLIGAGSYSDIIKALNKYGYGV
ncbi:MAG: thioredoxin family protein [Bacilli bacterium]